MNATPDTAPCTDFKDLLDRYGDMAYRMAWRLTGGRESEARDLVQDGFLKIWRAWKAERPIAMQAWIYRLLHNLYIDTLRRQNRLKAFSLDFTNGDDDPLHEVLPSRELSLDRQLEQEDLRELVAHVLDEIDPEFRLPVILCDMEGLSYEAIAQILACPIGTVRSRIHRGRNLLREKLAPIQTMEVFV